MVCMEGTGSRPEEARFPCRTLAGWPLGRGGFADGGGADGGGAGGGGSRVALQRRAGSSATGTSPGRSCERHGDRTHAGSSVPEGGSGASGACAGHASPRVNL